MKMEKKNKTLKILNSSNKRSVLFGNTFAQISLLENADVRNSNVNCLILFVSKNCVTCTTYLISSQQNSKDRTG